MSASSKLIHQHSTSEKLKSCSNSKSLKMPFHRRILVTAVLNPAAQLSWALVIKQFSTVSKSLAVDDQKVPLWIEQRFHQPTCSQEN